MKTTIILFRERRNIVICQNPSIVLALFLTMVKYFIRIKVCVDAHNAGIFRREGKSNVLNILSSIIQKTADLTLGANSALKDYVETKGGKALNHI